MMTREGRHATLLRILLFTLPATLLLAGLTSRARAQVDYEVQLVQLIQVVEQVVRGGQIDRAFFDDIAASGDPLYAAPLIDAAYFFPSGPFWEVFSDTLEAITGERRSWTEHFEWAGREDIALPPGYDRFKGLFLATFIDPAFARFFDGVEENARINLAEVVWGGVRVDGIPSLVNSRQISPQTAATQGENLFQFCRLGDCRYPAPDELVFGVSLDGDARAYPLRLLNWHEMFNDVVGHTPMFDAPEGEAVCNYRAPTPFRALARHGRLLLVEGASAGCPARGWLDSAATGLEDAAATLPDAAAGQEPLAPPDGLVGSVPGRPVMLAYCTLCGAGVLYDAVVEDLSYRGSDGERVDLGTTTLEFGSSGLLMRSNKLMYDRTTFTVWNAITGVPAFGPLAGDGVRLRQLPVVVTDWASWLAEHPDSSVLSLETGHQRPYADGAAYADYFNSPELMFPVWQQDGGSRESKSMVFALSLAGIPKAYPLETLIAEGVSNDALAGTELVLITRATPDRAFFEPGGAAVRAYRRGGRLFAAGAAAGEVVDESGQPWRVTEEALLSPGGERLERLPGHLAFWFGWHAFHPETLVYGEE